MKDSTGDAVFPSRESAGTMADEADLIREAKRGDKNAFERLFLREYKLAYNLFYQLCGDAAAAEDLAQDTFLQAFQKIRYFRHEAQFRTWLCRIGINLFLRRARRKPKLTPVALEEIRIPAQGGDPERVVIKREIQWCIHHTLQYYVPEKFRIVLVLRDIQNLSYKEISGILGLTEQNVKNRIHRARLYLKSLYTHPQSPCRGFIREYRCTCDGILDVEKQMISSDEES